MQLCFRGSTDLFPLPRDMLPSFLSSRSTRRRKCFRLFTKQNLHADDTPFAASLPRTNPEPRLINVDYTNHLFYVLGVYSRHRTSPYRRLHWHPTYHIQRISSHLAASFRQLMFYYHQTQPHCIERKSALQPPCREPVGRDRYFATTANPPLSFLYLLCTIKSPNF